MKVGAYVQPYDFFPIIKTLALHGAKFIPDVETHSIHPTVKSLSFDIETWVILALFQNHSFSVSPSLLESLKLRLIWVLDWAWVGLRP